MMKDVTYVLLAINALFTVGMPIIKLRAILKEGDDDIVLRQSGILSLLGWGLCAVMFTMLVLKVAKPASWPGDPIYMYVTAAITLLGLLLCMRGLILRVMVKKEGLDIRTVFRKKTFFDYRDLEMKGKFSNQLVCISSRRGHLCTLTAKKSGVATMIRRWHEATWYRPCNAR